MQHRPPHFQYLDYVTIKRRKYFNYIPDNPYEGPFVDIFDTSKYSKEEAIEILRNELAHNPVLFLTGPQGGGKTTLSVAMADENVGAIYEGRARSAQPVILIRRDCLEQMEKEIVEHRKLPIFDGDGPAYVDVTMLEKLNFIIEHIFDLMEMGEERLYHDIRQLTEPYGIVPKRIEIIADDDILVRRRLQRHMDATERLTELLEKEKKYEIKSNIWGIQGARVLDIMNREGVGKYENGKFSRTIEDFDRVIPTKDMTIGQCLLKMVEIANEEGKETGFLIQHTKDGKQKIMSDIVVGKPENSMIGVTLLEIYIGYRQDRHMYQTYTSNIDGNLELIHTFTPHLQAMTAQGVLGNIMLDQITEIDETGLVSEADKAAAERFGITVTVVDSDGNIESSTPKRAEELDQLMYTAFLQWKHEFDPD